MTNPAGGSEISESPARLALSERARRDRAMAIRVWAARHGIPLDPIGRIPKRVVELWQAEQEQAS